MSWLLEFVPVGTGMMLGASFASAVWGLAWWRERRRAEAAEGEVAYQRWVAAGRPT